MRIYEELFIIKPDAAEEEIGQVVEQIQQVIVGGGGTIDKIERWGIRRLAYRVMKYEEGFYVFMQFKASPDTVKEIERRLRVLDLVIKFLTVRIDRRLKRAEKRKQHREKRAARKPAPVAPAPQIPATPAPQAHATPAMPEEGGAREEKN